MLWIYARRLCQEVTMSGSLSWLWRYSSPTVTAGIVRTNPELLSCSVQQWHVQWGYACSLARNRKVQPFKCLSAVSDFKVNRSPPWHHVFYFRVLLIQIFFFFFLAVHQDVQHRLARNQLQIWSLFWRLPHVAHVRKINNMWGLYCTLAVGSNNCFYCQMSDA